MDPAVLKNVGDNFPDGGGMGWSTSNKLLGPELPEFKVAKPLVEALFGDL